VALKYPQISRVYYNKIYNAIRILFVKGFTLFCLPLCINLFNQWFKALNIVI